MRIVLVFLLVSLFLSKEREPDPMHEFIAKYHSTRDSIFQERKILGEHYLNSKTISSKDSILRCAGKLFTKGLENGLLPYWYGTPWAYYGYGDTPQVNYIACGYFVAVLLRDMGARVNVPGLAEIASGDMIEKLDGKQFINTSWHEDASAFFERIKKQGNALYVVGLDCHTGFLLCDSGKLNFIDSSPDGVSIHPPETSDFVLFSKIRVTGNISNDPRFLEKWLGGDEFK